MYSFFTLGIIQLLGSISPGPDSMLIIKNSLSGSQKHGIFTAIGIASALIVHISYINLGLASVILYSKSLFNIIRISGAIYLIYLGIKAIFSKITKNTQNQKNQLLNKTPFNALKEGFICNLLNPKAIFFLIGIFTLVTKQKTSILTRFIYGIEIVFIPLIWFSFISCFLNIKLIKTYLNQAQIIILRITGAILIFLGIKLLFTQIAI